MGDGETPMEHALKERRREVPSSLPPFPPSPWAAGALHLDAFHLLLRAKQLPLQVFLLVLDVLLLNLGELDLRRGKGEEA